MRQRAIVLGVLAAGVAVGVYSLRVARGTPAYSLAGTSAAGDAALLAAGLALVACAAWRPLLVAAGFAWFLPEWNNPGVGSALAFTIGLCLYAACGPLVAHAVIAHPGGAVPGRIARAAVAAAYAGGVLVLGVIPALFTDPVAAEGCNACPRNLVLVAGRAGFADDVTRAGVYAGLVWALALAGVSAAALVRSTSTRRPVLAAGAVYLGLVAATFAASLDRGFLSYGTLEHRLWLGEAAALVGVAGAVAWGRLRVRRARSAVARLVVELAESPPPGGLRGVLATIVGDPELVLAYPLAQGGLVDGDGRRVDPAARPARTSLIRDGRPVAVLLHAPGVIDDAQLVDEIAAAASLALENERLQAEVRARVEELRASRARIVAAGDLERKRLERNLHDGAQQRLVALSLSLRLLRSRLPSPALRRAEAELDGAIVELRELAHGIFPAVLADAGLAVAVDALAEEGQIRIGVGPLPERRFAPAIETAAYTVVAEAARTARREIAVRGEEREGTLVVEVETDGDGALDVLALEDRLGALDGRLAVEHRGNGRVTIRAELPCAS
jgi:signal transduction histidine kinase